MFVDVENVINVFTVSAGHRTISDDAEKHENNKEVISRDLQYSCQFAAQLHMSKGIKARNEVQVWIMADIGTLDPLGTG